VRYFVYFLFLKILCMIFFNNISV